MSSQRAAAALVCGALALLPGCGSGSKRTIPTTTGEKLVRAIQAADQYSANGHCSLARRKVVNARFLVGRLPSSVDSGTRQGLTDGLARLDSLITSECAKPQTNTTTTQTQSQTQTTQSQTTPTVTSQTQTTPTQTQTTQTGTVPTTTSTGTTTTGTTTTGNGGTPPPPPGTP